MTEKKVVHQIKLDRSVKALLWGFVVAIALNAVPDGYLIEDAMAQATEWTIKNALNDCNIQEFSRATHGVGGFDFRCS
jgi:hypothetical protein